MSEVLGVGVDLCSIERIEKAIQKDHFKRRVFTEQEISYFTARGKQAAQSAAAMYAAKEAVVKALGTGFSEGIMPEQIEVQHLESGAPKICLYGYAEAQFRKMNASRIEISLSHENGLAIAFAVLT